MSPGRGSTTKNKIMKIGIITPTFNEPDFIVPCIKQFDSFDFYHLILVGNKPWHGDWPQDHTWVLAKQQAAINSKVDVIIDSWTSCAEQFNFGMKIFEQWNYDWVLIVDTDEFYTPVSLGQLIGQLRASSADIIYAPQMHVYWKTPEYKIIPRQDDNPVIAARPNIRFNYIRSPEGYEIRQEAFMNEMHHMSYVRNDAQMGKKITTFEHQHEFDREKWYNEKWLAWTPEMKDLHPVIPKQFKQAIREPAPPEILRLLNA